MTQKTDTVKDLLSNQNKLTSTIVSREEAKNAPWHHSLLFPEEKETTIVMPHQGFWAEVHTDRRSDASILLKHAHTRNFVISWMHDLSGETHAVSLQCQIPVGCVKFKKNPRRKR